MRRLILHVGNPKTGTTSLQQFFFDNRATLLEQGVLYPVSESRPRNSHSNMVLEYTHKKGNYNASGITFASLEATARACDWDALVISSEFFLHTGKYKEIADAIAALIDKLDLSLTVVAFFRPQHVWMNSGYCQVTKTFLNHLPFTEHLRRTIDHPRYDYCESMKTWLEWPNGNFVARPFSGRYLKPDLETYFADAAGLDAKLTSILANSPRQVKNVTPGPFDVEISRRLTRGMGNNSKLPARTVAQLRKFISQSVLLRNWDAAPFNGVDNHLRSQIEERFGSSNEKFAQRLWGKSWNAVFEDDYSRDLAVNDLVQVEISEAEEAAITNIVEEAANRLGASPEEKTGFVRTAIRGLLPVQAIAAKLKRQTRKLGISNPLSFIVGGRKPKSDIVRYRTPLFHEELPVVFLWAENCGCTSLAKWFFYQTGLLDEALEYNPWIHRYEKDVYKSKPGYRKQVAKELKAGNRRVIKFTRDPFKRAVSSFLMLSGRRLQNPSYFGNREWKKLRKFKYGDEYHPGGASFKDFLRFVKETGGTIPACNGHFAAQFNPSEKVINVEVHDIAEMATTLAVLEKECNLKTSDASILESKHWVKYSNSEGRGTMADVIVNEMTFAENAAPTYLAFYDAASEELAASIFADDFAAYGYSNRIKPEP